MAFKLPLVCWNRQLCDEGEIVDLTASEQQELFDCENNLRGWFVEVCTNMAINVRADVCIDMGIDMHIEMCIAMCIDMRTGICIGCAGATH